MSHKKKRYSKDEKQNDNGENKSSTNSNQISNEDMESLRLLSLQLRGILLDFYGESLFFNSTMQGISYILSKYDNVEGNEENTTLEPDTVALKSAYAFLAAKIIFINISFTRFNIVSEKKAQGTFKYSLLPNYFINIGNVLNLIVSYYFVNAAQGIVARDNIQPVFGI